MHLQRIVAALAFISSLVAFLVVSGTGLFLLLVESSGERGSGALLALAGALAFAAALAVLLAREDALRGPGVQAAIAAAAVLAALPVAALSWAALRFAGLPIGSRTPTLDWAVFSVGVVLALGAVSILLLGYLRLRGRPRRRSTPREADLRAAQRQLRAAIEQDRDIRMTADEEDDIRVRRV
jgi:hypothetical protein